MRVLIFKWTIPLRPCISVPHSLIFLHHSRYAICSEQRLSTAGFCVALSLDLPMWKCVEKHWHRWKHADIEYHKVSVPASLRDMFFLLLTLYQRRLSLIKNDWPVKNTLCRPLPAEHYIQTCLSFSCSLCQNETAGTKHTQVHKGQAIDRSESALSTLIH